MYYTMYCDDLLDQFGVERKMGSLVSKIASLTKKHGEGLYVSNDSLAKMIKMSPRTIRRWLTVLSDKGVLAVQYLSSVSRKIFFTEKFAKCLNNIIGGGGYQVPPYQSNILKKRSAKIFLMIAHLKAIWTTMPQINTEKYLVI